MEGKVLKTLVSFSDYNNGVIYRVDTIEYAGRTWLVPGWVDNPKEGWRTPERIICLDVLAHQKTPGGLADFLLCSGTPKAVFEGQIPPEDTNQYIIIEKPDIRFPEFGG